MRTNFSARPNENKGADFTAGADNGVWRNHRRWMDAGLWLRWRVEQPGDGNEARLRPSRH